MELVLSFLIMVNKKDNHDREKNKEEVQQARDDLDEMGVKGTWDLLKEGKKKKKEEEKREFRGFD
ncbi:MAG: hypothetical protein BAJALOKI2v1_900006 [Promethearchaeota archaeon]|nr:MAG: hypothetical protein BAJALOKI2v1_900006 [Candidatus Lokiarchaeota archaeon]